jgi:hypothetical protein
MQVLWLSVYTRLDLDPTSAQYWTYTEAPQLCSVFVT